MSAIAISAELLAKAKNELNLNWATENSDEENKLIGQLQRGIAYITSKTGFDKSVFDVDDDIGCRHQELLFNYVMYESAGSLYAFFENYRPNINDLKRLWEVNNHEETGAGS